jgi:hypothetical protein
MAAVAAWDEERAALEAQLREAQATDKATTAAAGVADEGGGETHLRRGRSEQWEEERADMVTHP